MSTSEFYNRTALLMKVMEKGYSTLTKHEIMHLFANIDPNQKEEAAAKMRPLVEASKSEKEALLKAREIADEYRR